MLERFPFVFLKLSEALLIPHPGAPQIVPVVFAQIPLEYGLASAGVLKKNHKERG